MRTPSFLSLVIAVLVLCTGAFADSYQIFIQPIQIRSDDGSTAANSLRELFEAEGNKIYAQAGIRLCFLPWTTVDDSSLLSLQTGGNNPQPGDEFYDITNDPTSYGGSSDSLVINMWFAEDLDGSSTLYGLGWIGANGVAIGWDAVAAFNSGVGRLDTIAHELGHNLGLGHLTFGAGGSDNLMTSGGTRNVPGSINDINPDGSAYDKLTAAQITKVLASDFVQPVPEPGTILLVGLGVVGVGLVRRRRRRVSADA